MKSAIIRILLADDDPDDRLLFSKAFSELKIKTLIHTVHDGAQLMDHLITKKGQLPHIIFLDLNMPRKNGIECLKEIKGTKKLKDVSIAIYSTSASKKDIDETFINGANIYIQKPASFNTLKQVLEKAITVAWDYQLPPFNKDNFLLKI